jgi:predicted PurR-regulated permease PerM
MSSRTFRVNTLPRLGRYSIRLWLAVLLCANLVLLSYIGTLLPLTVGMVVVGTVCIYIMLVPVLWFEKGVFRLLRKLEEQGIHKVRDWKHKRRLIRLIVLSGAYLIGIYMLSFTLTQLLPSIQQEAYALFKLLPKTIHHIALDLKFKLDVMGHQHPSLIPIIKTLPFMGDYGEFKPLTWELPPEWLDSLNDWFRLGIGESNQFVNTSLTRLLWMLLLFVYIFYALLEGQFALQQGYNRLPVGWRSHVKAFVEDLHQVMLAFVQGQVFLGLITGLYMFVVYSLFGVDYALLFASLFAVAELLPIIGTYIGFTPALLFIAFTGDFTTLIGVFTSSYIWQSLKDNILQPQLMGNKLGMHPVFILVSLVICGKLGGVLGILLAIPVAAMMIVTLRRIKTFQFSTEDEDDLQPIKVASFPES